MSTSPCEGSVVPESDLPLIGLTMGDPAGIGPELVARVLGIAPERLGARLAVYGSLSILRQVSHLGGLPPPDNVVVVETIQDFDGVGGHCLIDTQSAEVKPGVVQRECGRLAASWIRQAVDDALQGAIRAIVTAPINKYALRMAGEPFPGHTEMLAHLCGVESPRMFFWSPDLAVGLVTIHLALSQVPAMISTDSVLETIRQVDGAMRTSKLPRPRIGVLGLNPHAGEDGLFGREEIEAIEPAVMAAREQGIDAHGPLVPDTALRGESRAGYDAFVAMYHDQGLIPFKMLAFDTGVNVTLGLPFCRTSPDHGTAFDIAWQGKASPKSLLAAIEYAVRRLA